MTTLTPPRPSYAVVAPAPAARHHRPVLLAWAALLLVLGVGLPLFLRMPLTYDTVQYDLCARTVLRGGAMYRDAADNNMPGVIWIQAAARAMVGWRSESLRLVDFALISLTVLLLLRWLPARGVGAPARVVTAAVFAVFYLFSAEHIHCQRDCWMLLPAVAALSLRRRQLLAAVEAIPYKAPFARAVLEGMLWGAAVWIKPFVLVPAAAGWLVGNLLVKRASRAAFLDAGGLLVGGLLVGGLGLAWLAATGAWDWFWEFLLVWNRDYAALVHNESRAMGLFAMTVHYVPWSLVHLAAVPIAVIGIARALGNRSKANPAEASRALLSAFYLGWLAQAVALQRITDYAMAASAFPAIILVAEAVQRGCTPFLCRTILAAVAAAALCVAPGLRLERLALWSRCCREGSTPELRDLLTVPTWRNPPDYQDLARVEEFLRSQGAADGEVTCLSGFTYLVYSDLNLEPSTRFHGVEPALRCFSSHVGQIRAELEASRTRYVLSDLSYTNDLTEQEAKETDPKDPLALPPAFLEKFEGAYPWDGRIVFRAGKYVVHRVNSYAGFFWRDDVKGTGDERYKDQYEKFFAGRLSLADETEARRSVAAIDELYSRSEAEHDLGARHKALLKALTMCDQANLSGKKRESELFRRWLESRLEKEIDLGVEH
jgi:hypothetical protein